MKMALAGEIMEKVILAAEAFTESEGDVRLSGSFNKFFLSLTPQCGVVAECLLNDLGMIDDFRSVYLVLGQ